MMERTTNATHTGATSNHSTLLDLLNVQLSLLSTSIPLKLNITNHDKKAVRKEVSMARSHDGAHEKCDTHWR